MAKETSHMAKEACYHRPFEVSDSDSNGPSTPSETLPETMTKETYHMAKNAYHMAKGACYQKR